MLFCLLFLPNGTLADFPGNNALTEENKSKITYERRWQWFILPSGAQRWDFKLIPVAKAEVLSLQQEIINYIISMAQEYNVRSDVMLRVAKCESNYNPNAYNPKDPNGGSWGLFQFQKPTFKMFAVESKMNWLEIENWKHQTELASWSFANGKEQHWACWIKNFSTKEKLNPDLQQQR